MEENWLSALAYVLEELLEPMLFSANTMVEHGLNVDAASDMTLLRGQALMVLPADAVPMEARHSRSPIQATHALVVNAFKKQILLCTLYSTHRGAGNRFLRSDKLANGCAHYESLFCLRMKSMRTRHTGFGLGISVPNVANVIDFDSMKNKQYL
eukprot:6190248-Pleurochrysis_carterae.AAC.1